MAESVRVNFVTGAVRRYVPEIEAIAGVPEQVERLTAGRDAAWLRASMNGEWSPARVIGHLVAYAAQSRENLYRMSYMTDPIIKPTDDEGQAELEQWDAQSREQLLARLEQAIASVTELLKELPDSSWGRPGQHPDAGRRSILQQTRSMAAHFEEHLGSLAASRPA